MSSKHLSTGSTCPPPVAGLMRCYSMKYCPYAQRARIILELKKVKHEIVNIHLRQKPEWLFEKSPLGKVPSLELDGQALIESLVICDYLDEAYPEPPLYPTDPWSKGRDRMFLELFGKVTSVLYKVYFARGDEQVLKQGFDDIKAGMDIFEAELRKRNARYFGGEKPGMLDYMIWPWMERIPVAQKFASDVIGHLPDDRFSKLLAWMEDMKKDPAVKATYISPETHYKYLQTSLAGSPDYDMPE